MMLSLAVTGMSSPHRGAWKGAPPASRAGPIVSAFELPEFGPRNLGVPPASAAPAGIERRQAKSSPAAATSEQVSRLEGQLSELRSELAASTSASSAAARVTADSQAFTALDATLFGVAAVSTGSYVSVRRDMERARKEEKERQRQQQAERSSQLVRTAVGASMVTAAATAAAGVFTATSSGLLQGDASLFAGGALGRIGDASVVASSAQAASQSAATTSTAPTAEESPNKPSTSTAANAPRTQPKKQTAKASRTQAQRASTDVVDAAATAERSDAVSLPSPFPPEEGSGLVNTPKSGTSDGLGGSAWLAAELLAVAGAAKAVAENEEQAAIAAAAPAAAAPNSSVASGGATGFNASLASLISNDWTGIRNASSLNRTTYLLMEGARSALDTAIFAANASARDAAASTMEGWRKLEANWRLGMEKAADGLEADREAFDAAVTTQWDEWAAGLREKLRSDAVELRATRVRGGIERPPPPHPLARRLSLTASQTGSTSLPSLHTLPIASALLPLLSRCNRWRWRATGAHASRRRRRWCAHAGWS